MFQSFKRMNFLSKANFQNFETGDAVRMHLWLQKNGWPANEFVDLFMRANPDFDKNIQGLSFKLYLEDQFLYVKNDDRNSLQALHKRISDPRYKAVDKDNLNNYIALILDAKSK
jgi:hypothetical protein